MGISRGLCKRAKEEKAFFGLLFRWKMKSRWATEISDYLSKKGKVKIISK